MKNKYINKVVTVILASLTVLSLTACGSAAGTAKADTKGQEASAVSETVETAEDTKTEETAKTTETVEAAETIETVETTETAETTEVVTIKAVTGGNPRPYVYVGEDDVPSGYDIEVLKAVFELLPQYDLEIEVADFSAVFAGLNAGTYQIGVNNFSYNAERAGNYLYTLPYDKVSYVFVYNKDAEPIKSLADAAGKSFEGGAGVSVTNAIEAWNELHPDSTINISYTDADTAVELQHIEDGTTDFGIIDGPMYTAYTEEFGFDVAKSDIPEEEIKLIADNLYAYYLLPKDQEQLRDEIDEAIIQLKENGTLKQLSEQFFGGVDQSPEEEVLKGGKTN